MGVLVDDGPGGGVLGFPELVVGRVVGGEEADFFAEVGDGSSVGGLEGTARVFVFEVGEGLGEEGGEGLGLLEVEGLQGEAAVLVEEADVAGGEVGGFGGGFGDDSDAEAVAVTDEGSFEGAELLEVAEGGIGTEDDEGIGFGDPVVGEGAGGFDEAGESGWELEIEEGVGGEFEAIMGAKDKSVEEGLIGGVGGVAADDVDE